MTPYRIIYILEIHLWLLMPARSAPHADQMPNVSRINQKKKKKNCGVAVNESLAAVQILKQQLSNSAV